MGESLVQCGEQDCSGMGVGGSFNACVACPPADSAACINAIYGSCDSFSGCEGCACQQCPGEFGMCKEVQGCAPTFDCMRSTKCQGSACLERCRSSNYAPEAFAFAEALWACYKGASCGCNFDQPPAVVCPSTQGEIRCTAYVGPDISFAPCCPSTVVLPLMDPGGTTTTGDDNPCGLDITRYYPSARICEPLQQSNPPRYKLLETCPDRVASNPPYNGALLKGCCRGADHTCGYYDDISGLGCLSASVFGDPTQLCGGPE